MTLLRNRVRFLIRKFLLALGVYSTSIYDIGRVRKLADLLATSRRTMDLMRLGSLNDGGYLVPRCLKNIKVCLSPGVANSCDFEIGLASFGIKSYTIDFSIERPPVKHPLISFERLFLGAKTTGIYISVDDLIDRYGLKDDNNLMLQMDIEGDEYIVLSNIETRVLNRFKVVIIEFHYCEQILISPFYEIFHSIIAKLCDTFYVVHINPNNCIPPVSQSGLLYPSVIEFTFVRKGDYEVSEFVRSPRHSLDWSNVPNLPQIDNTRCWFY